MATPEQEAQRGVELLAEEKKDIASSIYRSIMEASGTVKEKMMEEKKQEKTSSENTVSEPEENK